MTTKAEATKGESDRTLMRAQDHINSLKRRTRDIEEAVMFYEQGTGTLESIEKACRDSAYA